MDAEHIFAVCWGVSFFILGIVVLLGIADELMAGYNTASEEERKKYNTQVSDLDFRPFEHTL